jgi:DNA-binding Lrp family transcriptional regulator
MWNPVGVELDAVDRRMVALLLDNGRLPVNELALKANVSRATAYNRFDRLQTNGVVTGFTAVVPPEKVGLGVTALVLVNVDQRSWGRTRDNLLDLPGLEYLALTSGQFDMVLLVRVADIAALRDVVLVRLHAVEGVRSTQTVFVLEEQRLPLDVEATCS